ncbi:MAG TPA: sugar transferase [Polyangiaceae bacterium]|jgi:exopolysaccharide biosynthesis polyprenyl glycosylphosphotransferase|nr:sugar transferase [Polyangiaceae bacterium]
MTKQTAQNLNLIGDSIILLAASAVATKPAGGPWHYMVFLGMALGSITVWMLGGRVLQHYDSWNGRGMAGDVVLTGTLLAGMFGVMLALRLFVPSYAAGSQIDRFILVAMPCILWLRSTTSWLRRREVSIRPILVVGIGPLGRHTELEILDRNDGRRVIGHLRFADEAIHDRLPTEVLGMAADLEEILKKHVAAEVFIAGNGDSQRAEMQQCIRVLERFGIPFALPACGFRFGRARPEYERAVADGYIHYLSVRHKPVQLALKRLFDVAASGLALAVLSPIMVAVAILIKMTSRGSILFKQQRVGRHSRPFHMLKFRSMVVNAEELKAKLMALNEQAGPVFKMKRDPRITPIGRFIRKYSIDELPQLINVLRGEMSLVGPRPPVPSEVAKYEAWQHRRLSVRPGLTCVWQVSGRNEISFEEWMYLDMQYIDHWSLAQDFQLILKTVPVVLTGRGAS